MKEFKVGDRVVVYAGKRKVGIITTTDAGHNYYGPIGVECLGENGKYTEFVHPKQCRRLIKKPRRRIWARLNLDGSVYYTTKEALGKPWIEFREVKRK